MDENKTDKKSLASAARRLANAGRERQSKMAEARLPERSVRRALPDVKKPGRRGRRARARVLRHDDAIRASMAGRERWEARQAFLAAGTAGPEFRRLADAAIALGTKS